MKAAVPHKTQAPVAKSTVIVAKAQLAEPKPEVVVTFRIPADMARKLAADAHKRGMNMSAFARVLLEAAWSARSAETGDRDLDATVAAALLLAAGGLDTERIARALKCSEAVVVRIVRAWAKREAA